MKLLLVDDEAIIRKAFSRMISKEYPALEVVLAEHGLEALEMVATHHPDMMILDLGMMHMGGFEVLQQLAKRNQSIPTLVMSAYDMDDVMDLMVDASQQPDIAFIKKPVEREVFMTALARLIERVKQKD